MLYSFSGGPDGRNPVAGLLWDEAGNLYGTTSSGPPTHPCGNVFELSPPSVPGGTWTELVLHSFDDIFDGCNPEAPLVFDAAGNLYVTTVGGRTAGYSYGTVFEVSPGPSGWTENLLYSFQAGDDGRWPYSTPVWDSAGNLYGTTFAGGGGPCNGYGCGTIFKLSADGNGQWTETVLARPVHGKHGAQPLGGLLADTRGNLYGTACTGGAHGMGTVFEITSHAAGVSRNALAP